MAWQKACQSASTSGCAHLCFPTFEVSMKVRNTPSSCARRVRSSAPSRIAAPKKYVVNLGFTTFLDPCVSVQICNFHCFVIVYCNGLPEPVHYSAATFSPTDLYQSFHLDGRHLPAGLSRASARGSSCRKFLMVPHEADFFRFSVIRAVLHDGALQSYYATKPHTTSYTVSLHALRRPTECSPESGKQ